MSSGYPDIILEWQGDEFTVKNDFRALRQVERVANRPDVQADLVESGLLLPVDIAEIYGGLLRLGGAKASDEDVYCGLFRGDTKEIADAQVAAMGIISALMESRTPPEKLAGNENPPQRRKPRRSGRKPTNSQ